MRIAVSACLLGENCKYSGGNNYNETVVAFIRGHEVIPVCPERRCGASCPRPRVEQLNGRLIDEFGKDVDDRYRQGVADTMKDLPEGVELAILQPRSPTCGAYQIYDGTFSGKLIDGQGALAAAMRAAGIPVKEPWELDVPPGRVV